MLDALAKSVEDALILIYGEKMGFALFMFPFNGEGGAGDYVSNGNRKDMIKFLRETADRIETGKTIGRPIGTA